MKAMVGPKKDPMRQHLDQNPPKHLMAREKKLMRLMRSQQQRVIASPQKKSVQVIAVSRRQQQGQTREVVSLKPSIKETRKQEYSKKQQKGNDEGLNAQRGQEKSRLQIQRDACRPEERTANRITEYPDTLRSSITPIQLAHKDKAQTHSIPNLPGSFVWKEQ